MHEGHAFRNEVHGYNPILNKRKGLIESGRSTVAVHELAREIATGTEVYLIPEPSGEGENDE